MNDHPAPTADAATAPPPTTDHPRFPLGRTVATPAALALLAERNIDGINLLQRHVRGDWGAICAEDAATNEQALQCGARLMSSYEIPGGGVIWIITEADRATTTLLPPKEY
ncbi:MAG: hypothetical protein RL223_543 [Pseudomonadota bacterium]|jgi:hypothetical protein